MASSYGHSSQGKGTFTVYMNDGEKYQIEKWVERYPNIETGGDLFGAWIDDRTAVVQFVLGPGTKCRRTGVSFFQDIDYLREAGSYLTQKHGLCNIGQWHSHHRLGLTRPSGGDENTVWGNMPNLGLNRYIVIIATITGSSRYYYNENYGSSYSHEEGLTVNINPYLFEIKDGRRNDVLHGSFHYMKQNSPFRLDKAIQVKVACRAETINNVARYEIVTGEEKKDRKRRHNKTEKELESEQSKSKVKLEDKSRDSAEAFAHNPEKSTTTRSKPKGLETTTGTESNSITLKPQAEHSSIKKVQEISSSYEETIDQTEKDTATLHDIQNSGLGSRPEHQSPTVNTGEGTEPTKERVGEEEMKSKTEKLDDSKTPETSTRDNNLDIPFEHSIQTVQENNSLGNETTDEANKDTTTSDDNQNSCLEKNRGPESPTTATGEGTESTKERVGDEEMKSMEKVDDGKTPETSTQNKNFDITFQHSKETEKEDGSTQKQAIKESGNHRENDEAKNVNTSELTEPTVECVQEQQKEQRVEGSENGKSPETLTQKKEDGAPLGHSYNRYSYDGKRNFTVYMNEGERCQIEEWVKKCPDIETGGDLFGAWIDDRTAVVQFVLGPGQKCHRTTGSFYQDIDYLGDAGSYLTQQHGLCNIGQWHSHHKLSLTRPSGGDENTVWGNMPNLGLNRYIVIIATITSSSRSCYNGNYGSSYTSSYSHNEGLTVNINPYLFEIKDGRRNDVLHGSFHYMKQNSPFRLDKAVQVKVACGAETINIVKNYEGISTEEKKERKRPHNETEKGSTEPENKQSKSKAKVEGKSSNPQAVSSSLEKSTTTRSTSQAKEALDETAEIESNTVTLTTQPHHHSIETVQDNSSMDEKMIDQAETDDNQITSLESNREAQSSSSETGEGTKPVERLVDEQFKPIVQNLNESKAPATQNDNFGVPLEDSLHSEQIEKKEDGSMQNIVTQESGNHETDEGLHPNHTESIVEYFQDKQQQQVEESENEQLPEISTQKKEDGSLQDEEINESHNLEKDESAQVDVDMREHTEPIEECFRDKQTEQQVGDSENGKTLERSQPNDDLDVTFKHLPRSEEIGKKDDSLQRQEIKESGNRGTDEGARAEDVHISKDTEIAEKQFEEKQNEQQIDDAVNRKTPEKSTQKEDGFPQEQAVNESRHPEKEGVQANDVEMGEHAESGNHETEEGVQPKDVNISGEVERAEEHLQDKRKMEESENGPMPETSTQKKEDDCLQDLATKECGNKKAQPNDVNIRENTELAEEYLHDKQKEKQVEDTENGKPSGTSTQTKEDGSPQDQAIKESGNHETNEGASPNDVDMSGHADISIEYIQDKQKEHKMEKSENRKTPETSTQKKDDGSLQDLTKKEETGNREIDEDVQPKIFDMNGQTEFGIEHFQHKQKEQHMPGNKQSPEPPTQKDRLNKSDGLDREYSTQNTVLNASNPEDNPNHTEMESMEVDNDHFYSRSGATDVQQESLDKNPELTDACKKGKDMEVPDQNALLKSLKGDDDSNETQVESMDIDHEHVPSKDGATNVGQDTLDDKESALKQSGDGGKELDIVVSNEESSDCAQLKTAIPLPSSSQKDDGYVKKEEENSKEEKKGSMEIQGISDVTEKTESDTNISPCLHHDGQSFAKPVKDGERLGGGIDNLSEQNKAIFEDNEHNIAELGSASIFDPLQDYQGKEWTNKAEENVADTIIKADAMTHIFTAEETKNEGTDSQYEETMLVPEEATTNEVIPPLDGIEPGTEDGMNKSVINENQNKDRSNILEGKNEAVDVQIAHEQQQEMKRTDALEGEEHIKSESKGNDSTEMKKKRIGWRRLFPLQCLRHENQENQESTEALKISASKDDDSKNESIDAIKVLESNDGGSYGKKKKSKLICGKSKKKNKKERMETFGLEEGKDGTKKELKGKSKNENKKDIIEVQEVKINDDNTGENADDLPKKEKESKKSKQKSKGVEDSGLEESRDADTAGNRKVAKRRKTQEKKSKGEEQGKEFIQKIVSVETSL